VSVLKISEKAFITIGRVSYFVLPRDFPRQLVQVLESPGQEARFCAFEQQFQAFSFLVKDHRQNRKKIRELVLELALFFKLAYFSGNRNLRRFS